MNVIRPAAIGKRSVGITYVGRQFVQLRSAVDTEPESSPAERRCGMLGIDGILQALQFAFQGRHLSVVPLAQARLKPAVE